MRLIPPPALAFLSVGSPLPETPWRRVEPEDVRRFCTLTGETQWIHTDPQRAADALEEGAMIVPGSLLTALCVAWLSEPLDRPGILRRLQRRYDRISFRETVPVGTALSVQATPTGLRMVSPQRALLVLSFVLMRRFKRAAVMEGRLTSVVECVPPSAGEPTS